MDALSDVLKAVRLRGAIYFDVHASEPWVAVTPAGRKIVGRLFPGSDHLVPYHAITRGTCWGGLVGGPSIRLAAGDVIMFPHGDEHVMSSAPGVHGKPDLSIYRPPSKGQLPFTLSMRDARAGEDDGAGANFVCGFLGCDARPFNPLLAALPRVIHMSDRGNGALSALVQFAVAESRERRIGGEGVLGHLSELMFVDVVRRYLETLPQDRTGWLAGLRDPFVGRALAALHRGPERAWTIASLAREAGTSRTVLAERFTHLVGQPVMQYLTRWRMQLAANRLRSGGESVAAIAESVGYDSEAAFSRAFKKIVGAPPSAWRTDRPGGRRAPAGGR
jgi:AraC-like DNA-binding protein